MCIGKSEAYRTLRSKNAVYASACYTSIGVYRARTGVLELWKEACQYLLVGLSIAQQEKHCQNEA